MHSSNPPPTCRDGFTTSTKICAICVICGKNPSSLCPLWFFPDFTFPHLKLALFLDGCFWHSCPTHGTRPASNQPFWNAKLQRNRTRDRHVSRLLRNKGWQVARIWEHDLKPTRLPQLATRLHRLLRPKKSCPP